MDIYGINVIGVLLGMLAFMVVGFLWYGPIFGKRWMTLNGFTEESMKDVNMPVMMAKGLTNSLITAIGIAIVFNWVGVSSLMGAVHIAAVLWLFFSATTAMLSHIYEKQPVELTFIHFGNQLCGFVLAGIAISFF